MLTQKTSKKPPSRPIVHCHPRSADSIRRTQSCIASLLSVISPTSNPKWPFVQTTAEAMIQIACLHVALFKCLQRIYPAHPHASHITALVRGEKPPLLLWAGQLYPQRRYSECSANMPDVSVAGIKLFEWFVGISAGRIQGRAANEPSAKCSQSRRRPLFNRTFYWLKVPTSTFT